MNSGRWSRAPSFYSQGSKLITTISCTGIQMKNHMSLMRIWEDSRPATHSGPRSTSSTRSLTKKILMTYKKTTFRADNQIPRWWCEKARTFLQYCSSRGAGICYLTTTTWTQFWLRAATYGSLQLQFSSVLNQRRYCFTTSPAPKRNHCLSWFERTS